MKCAVCGLEMIVYQVTEDGPVYVCRNKRCPDFDKRLRKETEETPPEEETGD